MGAGDNDDGPNVDCWVEYRPWPVDKPFPLTPLDAWYVMRGYGVRRVTVEEVLEMPGQVEMSDGYLMLRQT